MQALPYRHKQELLTHHNIGRPLSHSIVFDCLRTMITNFKDCPDNHGTFVRVSNNRPLFLG
jgi:hypothetical protein